jgi:integrase
LFRREKEAELNSWLLGKGALPWAQTQADYMRSLAAHSDGHRAIAERTLTEFAKAQGVRTLADWTPAAVQAFLDARRALVGEPTRHKELRYLRGFGAWAVRMRLRAENPASAVRLPKSIAARERRALTPDECARLIAAALTGERRLGFPGPLRAWLYRLALETGFRASELRSLSAESFDLAADPPCIRLAAGASKNRQPVSQPIRHDLAERLRAWLPGAWSDRPFCLKHDASSWASMLRHDLKAARAKWLAEATTAAERAERERSGFLKTPDAQGRVVDFHALRTTFISGLVKSGASVKVCMDLARHSTADLTMRTYAKLSIADRAAALDGLPASGSTAPVPAADTFFVVA